MATVRELRSRIKSVQATKKITKAQELIATSRISKSQRLTQMTRPYAEKITEVIGTLASSTSIDNPYLKPKSEVNDVAVLVITSDSGQCGAYNSNVFKETKKLVNELKNDGKNVHLYVTGRKGINHFDFEGQKIEEQWSGFSQNPEYSQAVAISKLLEDVFIAKKNGISVDEIYLVYTNFVSMLSQKVKSVRLAPVEFSINEEEISTGESLLSGSDVQVGPEYEFEPDADVLLRAILPKYIQYRIYASMLDAAAAENAARRTAMKAATDNANELEKNLSRQANQARQASITQEISEIVGGTSAMSSS